MAAPRRHVPVMAVEVVERLGAAPGHLLLDLTAGAGGHALAFLQAAGAGARVIASDRDPEALALAEVRLAAHAGQARLLAADSVSCLADLARAAEPRQARLLAADSVSCLADLAREGVRPHAVLMDLGVSSMQLDDPVRGFSLRSDGPLDMRMDPTRGSTAADLLNRSSVEELERILREYGDEPRARRLAQAFVARRAQRPWRSTGDLRQHVETVLRRRGGRIHPATRVFQALRMAVNEELALLEQALPAALEILRPGGRLVVLAFHSGEDRIVKEVFRQAAADGRAELLTRKPLRPSLAEQRANPRSRSTRLRALRKVDELP